ncbi:hypothetical protein HK097_000894 [Rhizophlyctis rosea]|uniref:J domain-containing protein n=1 Tax=Rhizophlyctis rosea TaxID=64517 RepID=A0AAD5S7K3_9FUNG|nr:hypothetical protein HK097_000894 [Rhizophlyctis rosea]
MADDNFDVDTYLRTQSTAFNQDQEVDRILSLYQSTKNPLELLDLPHHTWTTLTVDLTAVKKSYRKRSLLLHPDKCKHPRAQEAFDILKKAEAELTDDEKRPNLLYLVRDARDAVFKRKRIPIPPPKPLGKVPDGKDPKQEEGPPVPTDPKLCDEVRLEARRMMQEIQTRDKIRLKNDVERKMTEAEKVVNERKRKMEHDKLWEETREERVGNWRDFKAKGVQKKKKVKKDDPYGGL